MTMDTNTQALDDHVLDLAGIKVHPSANAFPTLEGDEFEDLVRSIEREGLRERISLCRSADGEALLVDGRNRCAAMLKAGVDFDREQHVEWLNSDAEIASLVITRNVHRRHMTLEQRILAAARALEADGTLARGVESTTQANRKKSKRTIVAELGGFNERTIKDYLTPDLEPIPAKVRAGKKREQQRRAAETQARRAASRDQAERERQAREEQRTADAEQIAQARERGETEAPRQRFKHAEEVKAAREHATIDGVGQPEPEPEVNLLDAARQLVTAIAAHHGIDAEMDARHVLDYIVRELRCIHELQQETA